MKIGIIGTGDIGGALARHWGAAGPPTPHFLAPSRATAALAKEIGPNVKVGTPRRPPHSATSSCLPCLTARLPQVGRDYAAELKGKVVLDTGNPYPSRDGDMAVRDRAARHGRGVGANTCPARGSCALSMPSTRARCCDEAFRKPERIGIPLAADDAGGDEDRRAARERRRLRSGARGQTLPRARVRLTARRSTCAA